MKNKLLYTTISITSLSLACAGWVVFQHARAETLPTTSVHPAQIAHLSPAPVLTSVAHPPSSPIPPSPSVANTTPSDTIPSPSPSTGRPVASFRASAVNSQFRSGVFLNYPGIATSHSKPWIEFSRPGSTNQSPLSFTFDLVSAVLQPDNKTIIVTGKHLNTHGTFTIVLTYKPYARPRSGKTVYIYGATYVITHNSQPLAASREPVAVSFFDYWL